MGDGDETTAGRPAFSPDAVHLLRTTQQIQYQLSQMADQKASMLLGVTFVIFTISVGQARTSAPQLPVMILGAAAFVAAFLAVLAVLPQVKTPPRDDAADNVLFFGAFTRMSEAEYVALMLAKAGDTRSIFEAFARDIYQNGRVLAGKKYRLLGWAYRALLAGLVLSLIAFLAPFALALLGR